METQTLDLEAAVVRPEDIEQALARSARSAIRFLKVQVEGRVVSLRGYVRSYHEKQVAWCVARRVPGVHEVKDYVEVFGD